MQRDLAAALDARPIGALQWRVLVLCTLVILLDGFDVQAIAFTAPAIARDWTLAPGSLGPVFAAGLVGMAGGALVVGPLGDRYGRRAALLGSVLAFGLFTLATALARSVPELIALRVLTGFGLGGALPNATALMTEYAPARRRQLAIAVIFLGIPLGGMLGGVVANALVPRWGWPAVFVLGGVAPLLLVPLLALALPGTPADYAPRDPPAPGAPVRRLFDPGYRADTLRLWVVFFFNLMAVYFLISWIPTLLVEEGHGLRRATQTSVLLNLGGALGPLALAALTVRYGTRVPLVGYFLAGAAAVAAVGQAGTLPAVMALTFLAGFFTFGAQISMNALAAEIYPTAARATGVGWALGIGRLGSIFGPVVGGVLVTLALGLGVYFGLFGGLLLLAGLACAAIRRHTPRAQRPAAAPVPRH